MDAPAQCLLCGGELERAFSPNSNIWVPLHFRSVRTGGVEGNTSWSDFHDETEKELARMKTDANGNRIEVVRADEWASQAGVGSKKTVAQKEAEVAPALEKAFDAAWSEHNHIDTRS